MQITVKRRLNDKGIDVIGPIKMDRENKRGDKLSWQLLYIADPDYMVKPPFFIQWNDSDEYREEQFKKFYQLTFTIETVIISSEKRRDTVEN